MLLNGLGGTKLHCTEYQIDVLESRPEGLTVMGSEAGDVIVVHLDRCFAGKL